VAEGVEREEVLGQLSGYGCDVAQGYFLASPMAGGDFDLWYADRSGRTDGVPARC
jgi:EAL domain-containing protein (putative c-di-GMP-specific phosphodiesterase class I)